MKQDKCCLGRNMDSPALLQFSRFQQHQLQYTVSIIKDYANAVPNHPQHSISSTPYLPQSNLPNAVQKSQKDKYAPNNIYHWLLQGMKNQSTKQIMDVLYVNEPASRDFIQSFQFEDQMVVHKHQLEVTLVEQYKDLQIKNYLTVQKEGILSKVTEIVLENRVIRIIDTFESTNGPKRSRQISNQNAMERKKTRINKKYFTIFRDSEKHSDEDFSKDTKNVVKNMLRLFQTWLQEKLPRYRQVYDKMTSIVRKGKFNNNLVVRLVRNREGGVAFEDFLVNDARDYIVRSRINDKRTHFEAMLRYLAMLKTVSECSEGEEAGQGERIGAPELAMVKQE